MRAPLETDPRSIAQALIATYRDPIVGGLGLPPPEVVLERLDLVVKLALGRPIDGVDEAAVGAEPGELAQAALFFIGETLLHPGASHYEVLGLEPGATAEAIRDHYRLLIQVVHPDRLAAATPWPDDVAARVNLAYATLRDEESRALYDARIEPRPGTDPSRAAFAGRPVVRRVVSVRGQPSHAPEWLTHRVFGFARTYPASTIFSLLIGVSLLSVVAVVVSERGATLTRDEHPSSAGPSISRGPRIDGVQLPGLVSPKPDTPTTAVAAANPVAPGAAVTQVAPVAPVAATDSAQPASASPSPQPTPSTPPSPATTAPPGAASLSTLPTATTPSTPPPAPTPSMPVAPSGALRQGGGPSATQPARNRLESAVAAPPATLHAPTATARVAATPPKPSSIGLPAVVIRAAEASVPPPSGIDARTALGRLDTALSSGFQPDPRALQPAVNLLPSTRSPASADPDPSSLELASARPTAAKAIERPIAEAATAATATGPAIGDIEALMSAFIASYEGGKLDALTRLFDADARNNELRGRVAIRGDYSELFQRSAWRRLELRQLRWKPAGDRTDVRAEMAVHIGWTDGRQLDQRITLDIELIRRGERTLIARLVQSDRN